MKCPLSNQEIDGDREHLRDIDAVTLCESDVEALNALLLAAATAGKQPLIWKTRNQMTRD